MPIPIDLAEAGEHWRLLVSYSHDGPGQPDSLEILRVEWWVSWSEVLGAWIGVSLGGNKPDELAEPGDSPTCWLPGLHYTLASVIEDRINADSRLRERIVEKCLAVSNRTERTRR